MTLWALSRILFTLALVTSVMAQHHVFLHFELLPPAGLPAHAAQDFSTGPLTPAVWHTIDPTNPRAPAAGVPGLGFGRPRHMTSAKVGLNTARMLEPETLVPVMLWYEPVTLKISAYAARDEARENKTLIWSLNVPFMLHPDDFPRAPVPSAWRDANASDLPMFERELGQRLAGDQRALECTKPLSEVAKEKPVLDKQSHLVPLDQATNDVGLVLLVKRAVQASGEPLTFFIDRVWALSGLVVFLSDRYYDQLFAVQDAPH